MVILDTNVVSELRKVRLGRPDPNVARRADSVDAEDTYVSAIVIQELEMGVLLAERRDAIQGAVPRAWLSDRGDRAGAWHDGCDPECRGLCPYGGPAVRSPGCVVVLNPGA